MMELVLKIGDIVFKGIAAVAGIWIITIANGFQASMTAASMQNQRELADSSLRANMFRDLIDPIMGDRKAKLDPDRELLLTELLALNFHENFALKPLMVSVDKRLAYRKQSGGDHPQKGNAEEFSKQRDQLRSTAQLVVQRQLAMLTKRTEDSQPTKQTESQTCIYRIRLSIPDGGKQDSSPETGKTLSTSPPSQSPRCFSTLTSSFDELTEITSPNGIYSLLLKVRPEKWEDQSFRVRIYIDNKKANEVSINPKNSAPPPTVAGAAEVAFSLTWFDFPFIDNTLLADGTRFSVIIDQVIEEKREAVIKLIWFPKDYFSLRERPTNYSELRSALGLR